MDWLDWKYRSTAPSYIPSLSTHPNTPFIQFSFPPHTDSFNSIHPNLLAYGSILFLILSHIYLYTHPNPLPFYLSTYSTPIHPSHLSYSSQPFPHMFSFYSLTPVQYLPYSSQIFTHPRWISDHPNTTPFP